MIGELLGQLTFFSTQEMLLGINVSFVLRNKQSVLIIGNLKGLSLVVEAGDST